MSVNHFVGSNPYLDSSRLAGPPDDDDDNDVHSSFVLSSPVPLHAPQPLSSRSSVIASTSIAEQVEAVERWRNATAGATAKLEESSPSLSPEDPSITQTTAGALAPTVSALDKAKNKTKPVSSEHKSGQGDSKPRLTKQQQEALELHFQQYTKPTTAMKQTFAKSLGISLDKINNWFQNRRAKVKQDAKKHRHSGFNTFFRRPSGAPFHPSATSSFVDASFYDTQPPLLPDQIPHPMDPRQMAPVSHGLWESPPASQNNSTGEIPPRLLPPHLPPDQHFIFGDQSIFHQVPEQTSSGQDDSFTSVESQLHQTADLNTEQQAFWDWNKGLDAAVGSLNGFTGPVSLSNLTNSSASLLPHISGQDYSNQLASYMQTSDRQQIQPEMNADHQQVQLEMNTDQQVQSEMNTDQQVQPEMNPDQTGAGHPEQLRCSLVTEAPAHPEGSGSIQPALQGQVQSEPQEHQHQHQHQHLHQQHPPHQELQQHQKSQELQQLQLQLLQLPQHQQHPSMAIGHHPNNSFGFTNSQFLDPRTGLALHMESGAQHPTSLHSLLPPQPPPGGPPPQQQHNMDCGGEVNVQQASINTQKTTRKSSSATSEDRSDDNDTATIVPQEAETSAISSDPSSPSSPLSPGFPLRKDSTMSNLAESLDSVAVQSSGSMAGPGQPTKQSNLAARRQARRPAALGTAAMRSTSFHVATPRSPKTPGQALAPEQNLRRIKSSMTVSRVQKSGASSAQRSPLALTFEESVKSPVKGRRRPSIQTPGFTSGTDFTDVSGSGESGPVTPLSPRETCTNVPNESKQIDENAAITSQYATQEHDFDSFSGFNWNAIQHDFENAQAYDWSSMPPTSATGPSFASPPSTPQDGTPLIPLGYQGGYVAADPSSMIPHSAPAWQQTFHPGLSSPVYHGHQSHQSQQMFHHDHPSWRPVTSDQEALMMMPQRQRTFTDTAVPTGIGPHQQQPITLNNLVHHPGLRQDSHVQTLAAPIPPPPPPSHSQPFHFVHNTAMGGTPQFDMSRHAQDGFSPTQSAASQASGGKPTQELMIHEYMPPDSIDLTKPASKPKQGPPQPKEYTFTNTGPESYAATNAPE